MYVLIADSHAAFRVLDCLADVVEHLVVVSVGVMVGWGYAVGVGVGVMGLGDGWGDGGSSV